MEKQDIISREDLMVLVDSFYEKVKPDSLLGPVFSYVNWERHLPVMYNFWCSMLLGEGSYKGSPLQSHLQLTIRREHFDQWLKLFRETVDEKFFGEKADEIKMRALAIAGVFQYKMGLMKAT